MGGDELLEFFNAVCGRRRRRYQGKIELGFLGFSFYPTALFSRDNDQSTSSLRHHSSHARCRRGKLQSQRERLKLLLAEIARFAKFCRIKQS